MSEVKAGSNDEVLSVVMSFKYAAKHSCENVGLPMPTEPSGGADKDCGAAHPALCGW